MKEIGYGVVGTGYFGAELCRSNRELVLLPYMIRKTEKQ